MKILLIGLGRWGNNLFRVLRSLPVELYVAELQPERLEQARKLGVSAAHLTADHRDFADVADAAVVVTPAQTHFEICADFLKRGKDVFVEKPITLVSAEAKQLTELAAKHGRILQVGHIFRFDPASEWLREAIQAGEFGRINLLRGNFSGFKRPRG
ncbi:MAG: Gfo/Idh/MocA family oxidoreductase, partial [Pedosphaera parvula]|nr:Gfo/Idh/MocA family oxidoreductase [Pedosphaera parvula]